MILFDIANLKTTLNSLENKTKVNNFWDDIKLSTVILTEIKRLQNKIDKFSKLENEYNNLIDMNDLLIEEEDADLIKELIFSTKELENNLNRLELETLFSGKYDKNNAIITLHPGARWN